MLVEGPEVVLMLGRVVNMMLDGMLEIGILSVSRLGVLYVGGRCKRRRGKPTRESHGQESGGGNLLHGPNVA